MSTFNERGKSFEKKFAHDEELQLKVSARKNKYLGQWASQILGYDQEKEKEYIQTVIKSDFEEAGDEDVFRKLKADLKNHNISDEVIRKKMDSFKDREQNFEKKFAHDEELQFKVNARRNKYLGQWVSQILSYDSEKEKEYIHSVIKADFEEAGDEDVFRKLKVDLKDHNISDEEIRKKMNELKEKAKSEFV